jgi:hypothetical protein
MRNEQKLSEAVDGLLQSLGERDPRVLVLRGSRDPSAVARLVHTVLVDRHCDVVTIRRALWLSGSYNNTDVIEAIMAMLRERPELALNAGMALERIGDRRMLEELGAIALDGHRSVECRHGAVRAIGGIATAEAAKILSSVLLAPDENVAVLEAAINSLVYVQLKSGVSRSTSGLVRLIVSESADVRYSVLVALGNLGARDQLEQIARLRNDHSLTSHGKEVGSEAERVIRLLGGE